MLFLKPHLFGRLFLGLGFWQCRLGFFLPFRNPFLIPSLSLSSSVGSSPSSSSLFPLTNDHLHFSSQNLQMGMMDVTQKGLLPRTQLQDQTNKCCVDCNTTKTPLWRGGPAGPKSLCNACGIRFRKRRISTNRGYVRKKERPHSSTAMAAVSATTSSSSTGTTAINTTTTTTSGGGSGDGEEDLGECRSLRMRVMMPFREEVVVVQNVSSVQKQGKLGEEEQAAVLLMALSCGSVFA